MWLAIGFDKHLYFYIGFSSGYSRQCVPRLPDSRVLYYRLNSNGRFPQYFTCFSSAKPHTCWIDCSAWPIHDLSLASLHPFSSLTASWSGFFAFYIALRDVLNCSILCLDSMDGRFSAWPQWVCPLFFQE